MVNRAITLRLTYVEPVLCYDRYLSHLSAQLPHSTLPSAIFVSSSLWRIAVFCTRVFSDHIDDCCAPSTAELVHLPMQVRLDSRTGIRNSDSKHSRTNFLLVATMTLHRSINHDDTHLDTPFLSALWWSTGFLYHPYHRCNQAWTWIGRGLVTDSSTRHRMLRTINVDVHHNNSRGIVYRSMASALDRHQHHLISCGTNSYRWRCSLVPIYTSMCHRTYV